MTREGATCHNWPASLPGDRTFLAASVWTAFPGSRTLLPWLPRQTPLISRTAPQLSIPGPLLHYALGFSDLSQSEALNAGHANASQIPTSSPTPWPPDPVDCLLRNSSNEVPSFSDRLQPKPEPNLSASEPAPPSLFPPQLMSAPSFPLLRATNLEEEEKMQLPLKF